MALKSRRAKIPASLRASVWNTYIGEDRGTFRCICGSKVSQLNFECGHVIPWSQGGMDTLENLRPICSRCNRSMGTENLLEHIFKLGLRPKDIYRAPSPFLDKMLTFEGNPIWKMLADSFEFRQGEIMNSKKYSLKKNIVPIDDRYRKNFQTKWWSIIRSTGGGLLWTLSKSWMVMTKVINFATRRSRWK